MPRVIEATKDVLIVGGTEGRNPFEVLILIWAVAGGLIRILGVQTPGAVTVHLPDWMGLTWYILLCIGGLVGLAGVWLRETILSLLVERAGLLFIGPVGLAYSLALFAVGGPDEKLLGASTGMFAACAIGRVLRIWWQLNRVRSDLKRMAGDGP